MYTHQYISGTAHAAAAVSFPERLTDEELLSACERFGRSALEWRNKFIGLLPEVARRKLYENHGYESIFVFAKKLAGLSEEQVRLALNLRKRFDDKPRLKALLENGTVSINKLCRVVSIATTDNEEALAEKVQMLSLNTVKTLVRDYKAEIKEVEVEAKNLVDHEILQQGELLKSTQVYLAPDVIARLLELQDKGIDINELLRETLDTREEQIQQTKNELADTCEATDSRYIPKKIREVVRQEYGKKCSVKHCMRPSKELHHTQRFSVGHTHDPNYLAPMCHEHHMLAHAADVKLQEIKSKKKVH